MTKYTSNCLGCGRPIKSGSYCKKCGQKETYSEYDHARAVRKLVKGSEFMCLCIHCEGRGRHINSGLPCYHCGGKGFHFLKEADCDFCNGTGLIKGYKCVSCNGTGKSSKIMKP